MKGRNGSGDVGLKEKSGTIRCNGHFFADGRNASGGDGLKDKSGTIRSDGNFSTGVDVVSLVAAGLLLVVMTPVYSLASSEIGLKRSGSRGKQSIGDTGEEEKPVLF